MAGRQLHAVQRAGDEEAVVRGQEEVAPSHCGESCGQQARSKSAKVSAEHDRKHQENQRGVRADFWVWMRLRSLPFARRSRRSTEGVSFHEAGICFIASGWLRNVSRLPKLCRRRTLLRAQTSPKKKPL